MNGSTKCGYFPTREHYSAIKRNEALLHATIWIDLKNIMLNERSQMQKITYRTIPFIWSIQNRQIHKDRMQTSGCRGLGGGMNGEWVLKGYEVHFRGDENVMELDRHEVPQHCEYTKCHWIAHCKCLKSWIVMWCEFYLNLKKVLLGVFKDTSFSPPQSFDIFSTDWLSLNCSQFIFCIFACG